MSAWRVLGARLLGLALLAVAGISAPPPFAMPGDTLVNIAEIEAVIQGQTIRRVSDPAQLILVAPHPTRLGLYRLSPHAPDGEHLALPGPPGSPSQPATITPMAQLMPGERIVVHVQDPGRNLDPAAIDVAEVQLTTDAGQIETVMVYEAVPDGGDFYGVRATAEHSDAGPDGLLALTGATQVEASYQPAPGSSLPAPVIVPVVRAGLVFDGQSGAPVSGALIRLSEAGTGAPARVYDLDGATPYPAELVSGAPPPGAGSGGAPGEAGTFRFPNLPAGRYQLSIVPPLGHVFPSGRTLAELAPLGRNVEPDISFGVVFTQAVTGPLLVDVPLDAVEDAVVLDKQALDPVASVGDIVRYEVTLSSGATDLSAYSLRDTLPAGFRYLDGSARSEIHGAVAPRISGDGQVLTFDVGSATARRSDRLSYAAIVGAGARPGRAVNRVVAVNAAGVAVSRPAEAETRIREELLSSHAVIAGQVSHAPCAGLGGPGPPQRGADGPDPAAATGVAGVRLFLETGAYVLTDGDGLFHFENVAPGTHVVQVDATTLPEGYRLVACRDDTRRAGSARSQFVDVQGGSIWRANFRIARQGDLPPAAPRPEGLAGLSPAGVSPAADDGSAPAPSPARFDDAWMSAQTYSESAFILPQPGQTPRGKSIAVAVMHAAGDTVELRVNDVPVSALNLRDGAGSADGSAGLSRWDGLDLQRGENRLEARVRNPAGVETARLTRTVWFADEVHRAEFLAAESALVADGTSSPKLAFRFLDKARKPVFQGRLVEVSVAAPYVLRRLDERTRAAALTAAYDAIEAIRIGPEGVGYIALEPTLKSGRVQVTVRFDDGTSEDFEAWLAPAKRDWILVGLAEAEALWQDPDAGPDEAVRNLTQDGRVAFYAKGVVRGDWLLTIAADTEKRRQSHADTLFDEIDPNAYYTIYGDETWQESDAQSQYPVYLKLENNRFQAVFGDYATGLEETELSRYSRRFSGLRADYNSEVLSATAFAAETRNRFIRDELAADGTSGPFRLSQAPLIRGSERILIETRDRQRNDRVVGTRALLRDLDYELDVDTGLVFFRLPIPVADQAFNPNVIVAEYEALGQGEMGVTAGGRLKARLLDGRLEAGASAVRESDSRPGERVATTLVGADFTYQPTPQTEAQFEVAMTRREDEGGPVEASATLARIEHRGERLTLTTEFREEEAGFGLGQQSSATSGRRRYGASLGLDVGNVLQQNAATSRAGRIEAEVYREVALGDAGASRDVGLISATHTAATLDASLGLKAVRETYNDVDRDRESLLLTTALDKRFAALGLRLGVVSDLPIRSGGGGNEVSDFSARTAFTLDQKLWKAASLQVTHEITDGDNSSGDNTNIQLLWEPFAGTQLRAGGDVITQDSARRIGATIGLDQVWQISKAWDLSLGLSRRANVDGGDDPRTPVPDQPVSPFEDGLRSRLVGDDAYMSAYLGLGYRTDAMALSGRVETRDSAAGNRWTASLSGVREVSEALSFASDARYQSESFENGRETEALEIRIGAAWRPRYDGLIILSRLDLGFESQPGRSVRNKLVHNLALNGQMTERAQWALYHGMKYIEQELEELRYNGLVHQLGGEVRFDLTENYDIGLQLSWVSESLSQTSQWSFGPSLGISPRDDIWVSFGWNFIGYDDEDFRFASYARQGPFIRFRFKFDQGMLTSLMGGLGGWR